MADMPKEDFKERFNSLAVGEPQLEKMAKLREAYKAVAELLNDLPFSRETSLAATEL